MFRGAQSTTDKLGLPHNSKTQVFWKTSLEATFKQDGFSAMCLIFTVSFTDILDHIVSFTERSTGFWLKKIITIFYLITHEQFFAIDCSVGRSTGWGWFCFFCSSVFAWASRQKHPKHLISQSHSSSRSFCSRLGTLYSGPSLLHYPPAVAHTDITAPSISCAISASFAAAASLRCFSSINQGLLRWQSLQMAFPHPPPANPSSKGRGQFLQETLKNYFPAVIWDWKCK